MGDAAQGAEIVAGAHILGQTQQPLEHDRHEVAAGDAAGLDRGQHLLVIPLIEQHRGDAVHQGLAHVPGHG